MADLTTVAQPAYPNERVAAAAELAQLRRNPTVIDGEVGRSWSPRPFWPVLAASGSLLALGVAEVAWEVIR